MSAEPNLKPHLLPQPQQNRLLAALSPAVQDRLFPHLELVSLQLRETLCESRCPLRHVYFPTDCIISVQYILENGASTGLLLVGNEGMYGINAIMSDQCAPNRSLVQSAGHAYRLERHQVREEFARHGQLMALLLCYTLALIEQVAQTAVCNRQHSIDQQLCRWLLLSMDRLSHNKLSMTQEFIANILGVRRESVTVAIGKLEKKGVIVCSRGMIRVLDREKLESLSCECYRVLKEETDQLLQ